MNKKPIQKEEVKTATEMMVNDMQEEEYYRIKHTPSDTFIEGSIDREKEAIHHSVHYILQREIADRVWYENEGCEIQLKKGLDEAENKLSDYVKSSLQSQRQSILEEIEKKKKNDNCKNYPDRKIWEIGAYNQALEDIKQIIND